MAVLVKLPSSVACLMFFFPIFFLFPFLFVCLWCTLDRAAQKAMRQARFVSQLFCISLVIRQICNKVHMHDSLCVNERREFMGSFYFFRHNLNENLWPQTITLWPVSMGCSATLQSLKFQKWWESDFFLKRWEIISTSSSWAMCTAPNYKLGLSIHISFAVSIRVQFSQTTFITIATIWSFQAHFCSCRCHCVPY